MKKKRIEITFESDEVLIVRRRRRVVSQSCPVCGETVMMNLNDAAANSGIAAPRILRDMADDRVHFLETADGVLLICYTSIVSNRNPHST